MIDIDEQKRLVVEIFEITGCKVDADDPVIVAALFYSEKLRTSLKAHQKLVEKNRAESRQELVQLHAANLEQFQKAIDAAVRQLSTQADASRARLDKQFIDLITVAKQAAHGEVPSIKRKLKVFLEGLRKAVTPGRGCVPYDVSKIRRMPGHHRRRSCIWNRHLVRQGER